MLQMLFAFLLSVFQVSISFGWAYLRVLEDVGTRMSLHELIEAHFEASTAGTMARACLRTAISSYNVWFWFKGLADLPTENRGAPTIFLFAPVHLRRATTFFKVLSILHFYYVGGPFLQIRLLIGAYRRQKRQRSKTDTGHKTSIIRSLKEVVLNLWEGYVSSSLPGQLDQSKQT
jgi:hypothetical protein